MNEPHDHILAVRICRGFRPNISKDTSRLLANLIMKCWDANAENRPTAYELYKTLNKWSYETCNEDSEIYSQIEEYDKIRENKSKNNSNENKSKKFKHIHKQSIPVSSLILKIFQSQ